MTEQQQNFELELGIGELRIRASGTKEWVEEQIRAFLKKERLEEIRELSKLVKLEPEEKDLSRWEGSGLAPGLRAKKWLQNNAVETDVLEKLFHRTESGMEVIADEIPGKNKKAQTINCCLLEGVRAFLETDDSTFTNGSARDLCRRFACYDENNHSANLKALGSNVAGTARKGFSLTAPGLKSAAELIKGMGGKNNDQN